jgi:DNA-binding transcriptional LysR family regulator
MGNDRQVGRRDNSGHWLAVAGTARCAVLTEAGRAFLPHAEAILASLSDGIGAVDALRGVLSRSQSSEPSPAQR